VTAFFTMNIEALKSEREPVRKDPSLVLPETGRSFVG